MIESTATTWGYRQIFAGIGLGFRKYLGPKHIRRLEADCGYHNPAEEHLLSLHVMGRPKQIQLSQVFKMDLS